MKREIPQPNKLSELTAEVTAAYDERKRTFDALRDPMLDETQRQVAIDAYKKANRTFEAAKNALLK